MVGSRNVARGLGERWRAVDEFWQTRIHSILRVRPRLLGTSINDRLVAEGFGGSYATVARLLRQVRGWVTRTRNDGSPPSTSEARFPGGSHI